VQQGAETAKKSRQAALPQAKRRDYAHGLPALAGRNAGVVTAPERETKWGRVPRADHARSCGPPTTAVLRRIQAACQAPSAAPCGALTPGCAMDLSACGSWHALCSAPQRQPCRPALCSATRMKSRPQPSTTSPCDHADRLRGAPCSGAGCGAERPASEPPRPRQAQRLVGMPTDCAERCAPVLLRRPAPRRGAPRPRRAQRRVGMATDCAEHCASTSMRRSASSSRSLRLGGTGTFSVATRHSTTFHSSCASQDIGYFRAGTLPLRTGVLHGSGQHVPTSAAFLGAERCSLAVPHEQGAG